MSAPAHRRWSDLTPQARGGIAVAAAVQLALLAAALTDLRRRDPSQVKGPRWLWALVSLINFVGPLTYFAVGRRRNGNGPAEPADPAPAPDPALASGRA